MGGWTRIEKKGKRGKCYFDEQRRERWREPWSRTSEKDITHERTKWHMKRCRSNILQSYYCFFRMPWGVEKLSRDLLPNISISMMEHQITAVGNFSDWEVFTTPVAKVLVVTYQFAVELVCFWWSYINLGGGNFSIYKSFSRNMRLETPDTVVCMWRGQ